MDLAQPIPLPSAAMAIADRAMAEVVAAVELVASGRARRVHVVGFAGLEAIAPEALAMAQAAGVGFALVRESPGAIGAIVGPPAA